MLPALETAGCEPHQVGRLWEFHCSCPGHSNGDRTPSGRAGEDEENNVWMKCYASGSGTNEIARLIGLHPRQCFSSGVSTTASRTISPRKVNRPPALPEHDVRYLHEALEALQARPDLVARLVEERGLETDVIEQASIGRADDRSAYSLPYADPQTGEFFGADFYKLRDDREDGEHGVRAMQGARRWLYVPMPELLAGADEVVVAEGALDALCALSHDRPAVASTGASVWRHEWSNELAALGVRRALVVGDADRAGRAFSDRAVASLRDVGLPARSLDLDPGRDSGRDLTDLYRDADA